LSDDATPTWLQCSDDALRQPCFGVSEQQQTYYQQCDNTTPPWFYGKCSDDVLRQPCFGVSKQQLP